MRRSIWSGLAAVAVGAVALTGCGGGDSSGGTDTGTPADVVIRGNDALRFDQAQYAARAGSVSIELVNDGAQPHTLLIEKFSGFKKLSVAAKGKSATGTATLEPGTYTIYCDVAGHRGAGMEAKLILN